MVKQVESGREIRCAPVLPFKLGKIQTAEVGSITPAMTGSVRLRGDARLTLPDTSASRVVAAALQGTRCAVDLAANFSSLAWRKLMQNAVAGLMALTHRRSGMFGRADIARLTLAYLQECLAVARAEGAELGDEVPQEILDKRLER